MTQNDKDAEAETKVDHITSRRGQNWGGWAETTWQEGWGGTDLVTETVMGEQWQRWSAPWLFLCHTVILEMSVSVAAWGWSKRLTWHCCPTEVQLSTTARGSCIQKWPTRKTKLQDTLTLLERTIQQEKGLLNKTWWCDASQGRQNKLFTLLLPK